MHPVTGPPDDKEIVPIALLSGSVFHVSFNVFIAVFTGPLGASEIEFHAEFSGYICFSSILLIHLR